MEITYSEEERLIKRVNLMIGSSATANEIVDYILNEMNITVDRKSL